YPVASAGLGRQDRNPERRPHRRAGARAVGHAGPRRPGPRARHGAAAAVALAVFFAAAAPERDWPRRPRQTRRLPAAGTVAAPHVGRRTPAVAAREPAGAG